jgi:hypothetical protein
MHATIAKTNVSELIKSAWKREEEKKGKKKKKKKNSPVIHKIISPWPKTKERVEYDDENDSWMHPKRQNANAGKV